MRSLRGILLGFLSLVAFPAAAWAQSGNAALNGSVTDVTGAVIPSAKVTVTNTATGLARTVETTGAGFYVVPTLIRGAYKITVAAPGFRTTEVTSI